MSIMITRITSRSAAAAVRPLSNFTTSNSLSIARSRAIHTPTTRPSTTPFSQTNFSTRSISTIVPTRYGIPIQDPTPARSITVKIMLMSLAGVGIGTYSAIMLAKGLERTGLYKYLAEDDDDDDGGKKKGGEECRRGVLDLNVDFSDPMATRESLHTLRLKLESLIATHSHTNPSQDKDSENDKTALRSAIQSLIDHWEVRTKSDN